MATSTTTTTTTTDKRWADDRKSPDMEAMKARERVTRSTFSGKRSPGREDADDDDKPKSP